MTLTLGFSPCPNDTFIFDALVNGGVDTGALRFEPVLEDLQTLNEWALAGRLDVSKISYGVLPRVADRYALLEASGALGKGVGPLLVARPGLARFDPATMTVAIPGRTSERYGRRPASSSPRVGFGRRSRSDPTVGLVYIPSLYPLPKTP